MSKLSTRINLQIDVPLSIQIEKEAEKRGITRAQYVKECIHDKLNKDTLVNSETGFLQIKEEIREIKLIVLSILEAAQKNKAEEKL